MKRTRVMFPVVSEKFGLVFFFWVIVFFSLSWSIGRRSNLAKRGVSCSSLLLHASQLIYVMNLLTLTTLTLHFTNPSVNAALKFYVTSLN